MLGDRTGTPSTASCDDVRNRANQYRWMQRQPETLTMAGKAPAGHSNRPFCRSEPGCWHRMFQADRRWSVGRSTVGPLWLPRRLRCRAADRSATAVRRRRQGGLRQQGFRHERGCSRDHVEACGSTYRAYVCSEQAVHGRGGVSMCVSMLVGMCVSVCLRVGVSGDVCESVCVAVCFGVCVDACVYVCRCA